MITVLCILALVWLAGSAAFVFAMAHAAKRPGPRFEREQEVWQEAA